MRRLTVFFTILTLWLSACANNSDNALDTGTTGQIGPSGVPYITNGDKRVEEALKNDPAPPVRPSPPPPKVKNGVVIPSTPPPDELRIRLKEFQISRYKLNEFKPSRFGDHRFKISIFFRDNSQADFVGGFTEKEESWAINVKSGQYTLQGKFTDFVPSRVEGDLTLTDNKVKESAHIIYSAYKAKITVREDRSKKVVAGSTFETQLKSLRENTFGWVHNWMVVRGPAFYLVDIVKQVDDPNHPVFTPPVLAFKGESLRTGDQDHPAESLTPKFTDKISLVGNSETGKRRWFQTSLEDPNSKETNDIIVDVQGDRTSKLPTEQKPGGAAAGDENTTDDDDDDLPDLDTTVSPAETSPNTTPNPSPTPAPLPKPRPTPFALPVQRPSTPQRPATPQPSILADQPSAPAPILAVGTSYLQIDMSLPRTARMTRDFARNRKIPGVVAWMNKYAKASDWHHRDLGAFYQNAFPFRGIIETIGRAYDVSSSFAYLTVIESPYFTGGKYFVSTKNVSSAVGPFQILVGTAKTLKMTTGAYDERRFFASSACGAARYIAELVTQFQDSDTTVAILGYYQGQGGAAKAIACTYAGTSNCQGKNYSRFIKLAKSYNYTYAQIDRVAAIPVDQRNYVNKKLAIYFISEDITQYGYPNTGVQSLPRNNSVWPTREINDPVCRETVRSMTGG